MDATPHVFFFWSAGRKLEDLSLDYGSPSQVWIGGSQDNYAKFQQRLCSAIEELPGWRFSLALDELTNMSNQVSLELLVGKGLELISIAEAHEALHQLYPEHAGVLAATLGQASGGNPAIASDVFRLTAMPLYCGQKAELLLYVDIDEFVALGTRYLLCRHGLNAGRRPPFFVGLNSSHNGELSILYDPADGQELCHQYIDAVLSSLSLALVSDKGAIVALQQLLYKCISQLEDVTVYLDTANDAYSDEGFVVQPVTLWNVLNATGHLYIREYLLGALRQGPLARCVSDVARPPTCSGFVSDRAWVESELTFGEFGISLGLLPLHARGSAGDAASESRLARQLELFVARSMELKYCSWFGTKHPFYVQFLDWLEAINPFANTEVLRRAAHAIFAEDHAASGIGKKEWLDRQYEEMTNPRATAMLVSQVLARYGRTWKPSRAMLDWEA